MLIYSKYSNERSREFSIRTDIYEENDNRYVEKCAVYPEGKEHIENMYRWYTELTKLYEETTFEFNKCERSQEAIRFEYIEGETLENYLDRLVKEDKIEEAEKCFCEYLDQLRMIHTEDDFQLTDKFIEVFGTHQLPEGLKCAPVTNIDMVCANLVLAEKPIILDYEWTFDFPIPGSYVIYRAIQYYVYSDHSRKSFQIDKLWEKYNISEELQKIYKEMEIGFQKYITGKHVPIRHLFVGMTPGIESNGVSGKNLVQVYFSKEDGYQEKDSKYFQVTGDEAHLSIDIPEKCKMIRIDPCETACAVYFERVTVDGKKVSLSNAVVTSGVMHGKWAYIPQNDPGIHDILIPEKSKKMKVDMRIYPGDIEVIRKMCDMGRENQHMKKLIQDMRNTKVWKLYQAYRNRIERKK